MDFGSYLSQQSQQQSSAGFPTQAPPQVKESLFQKIGHVAGAIASPFVEAAGTGVRGLQSIPQILKGDAQGAIQTQSKPIFGQNTFVGNSIPQNLGEAGQAASFLVPATRLGTVGAGAVAGGLQGAGSELQNPNTTASKVLENAAIGTGGGAAVGAATEVAGNLINKFTNRVTPLAEAEKGLQTAQLAREGQAARSVGALNDFKIGLNNSEDIVGNKFKQPVADLEKNSPGLTSKLTQSQLDELNNIKESTKFALPKNLNNESLQIPEEYKGVGPKAQATLKAAQASAGKQTASELTPTQAQDLMTRLNGLARQANSSDELKINQQVIGIRNELATQFSKDFGAPWDKAYSDYSKGITAVNFLRNLTNATEKYTPDQTFNEVLQLGGTPENKLILKDAVEQVAKETGVDMSNPTQVMHQTIDSQSNLDQALAKLNAAQKAASRGGVGTYIKEQGQRLPGYVARYLVARELFKALSKK